MTGLIAAMKRDPARHLAQNLLAPFNGSSQPLELPADVSPFAWSTGLEIVLDLTPAPDQRYTVDITSDPPNGKITAYFRADIYVDYLEFDFDINTVWSAGSVQFVCLKKVSAFGHTYCVAGFPVIMPKIPPIRFRVDLKRFGIDRVPLWSVNISAAVNALKTKERVDDDHLQLYANLAVLPLGVFPNPSGLAEAIANTVLQVVAEKLGQIPILGNELKYFVGFVQSIVDRILNALRFADTLQNYFVSRVQQKVADLIEAFWDPNIDVKVTKITGRELLSPAVTASGGQTQPALYLNFDSIVFDVNKDCPTGPELRLTVTAS
jgi:hypothetical protein